MNDDVLFECDFSIDELAVLADLLEIPALPGVDPEMIVPDEAKGAAARGLLARSVVVADGAKGTVEITQPYATMITTVLLAEDVSVLEGGACHYHFDGYETRVSLSQLLSSWQFSKSIHSRESVTVRARHQGGEGRAVEIA